MNLLRSIQGLGSVSLRVPRGLLYSTRTRRPTSYSIPRDSLSSEIITRRGDPRASIIPVLNQWIQDGKHVTLKELISLTGLLRSHGRFTHALEITEWMTSGSNKSISPRGLEDRLDLIFKVHGVEQAEKEFNSIPEAMRPYELYGALLNCYVQHKWLEKAEATMQQMRELCFHKTALPYDVMLQLYARLGRADKVESLTQEMEEKGINCNAMSFHARLNAYASAADIERIEKLLTKMVADPCVKVDWNAIGAAANVWLNDGLTERTWQILKRAEQLITDETRRHAYERLLQLYADCGRKDEVYRLWNLYKEMGKFYNSLYVSMISSLLKLDDFDGAEKIFKDWESEHETFDPLVPNLLLNAYCKKGLFGKAEALINRLIKGGKPGAAMWSSLAIGYEVDNKMEKAVVAMKKAIMASTPQWRPNFHTLVACVEYLEGQGKVEASAKLLKLLKERGYDKLVSDIKNRNVAQNPRGQMGRDETVDGENLKSWISSLKLVH